MKKSSQALFLILGSLAACDRSGDGLVPQPDGVYEPSPHLGSFAIMSAENVAALTEAGLPTSSTSAKEWCDSNTSEEGETLCHYGIVGQSEAGVKGGATLTFKGTGAEVCVVVDPETVFWNASVAAVAPDERYAYPDLEEDDGDMDLFVGLSSYYTGSPGIEIGDFKGFYTDSLGTEIEIEYGECIQTSSYTNTAHSGRASVEYCTINTRNREGVEYTVVLESFSIPLDDGSLGFAAMVIDGACDDYLPNECLLSGESLETKSSGEVVAKDCTRQKERAFCDDQVVSFCCAHPEMCGEDADYDACEGLYDLYDADDQDSFKEAFCTESDDAGNSYADKYCCDG
jgi:hypothetical protein